MITNFLRSLRLEAESSQQRVEQIEVWKDEEEEEAAAAAEISSVYFDTPSSPSSRRPLEEEEGMVEVELNEDAIILAQQPDPPADPVAPMIVVEQEEDLQAKDEDQVPEAPGLGCGILGRYPVTFVLIFAAVGIAAGVGLSFWDPSNADIKDNVLQWVGLIGDLFLRALQAVVLPLVFVNVILAVVDMMSQGQAGVIGGKMVGFYILTTILACFVAATYIFSFQRLYRQGSFDEEAVAGPASVQLGCGDQGTVLTHNPDGSVECSRLASNNSTSSTFLIEDIKANSPMEEIDLSDTIYEDVFQRLVTNNIVGSFIDANFAAIVVFAIVFGVALAKTVVLPMRQRQQTPTVVQFLKEIDKVFSLLIMWVLSVTPFAILSLMASTIGNQEDLLEAFQNVALLILTVCLAMATHVVVTYGGLLALITRSNPFSYMRHLIPAQTTVFACASSVATIPVTLHSVQNTHKVPQSVSRFIIPMGASCNMDGGAIYFPIAAIWLAVLNGLEPTVSDYILLVILSTIGSAGTASVPAASLVLIISAYNTVFGTTGLPYGFSFILAMDWFLDRVRATVNVTGDAVICRLVSHTAGLSMDESSSKNSTTGLASEDDAV
ncbi:Putative sodium-dependent excitatory amino acid transporter glt [Seminavis robusta]|uniref:Amino acid transporter n=1 Tax=Seminavis robusta TaxID=568900 RepID=A0A9N8EV21_9STRA|nr:Putative sodium-dependent excitatory amino acid transporter glt [Seminavis robusta]|eukprot:Sro2065_g313220.1 Putative sodium-dependent excitatory amino acid transporter glt (607) ;mRNA; r:7470-9290